MSINRNKLIELHRRVVELEAEIRAVILGDGLPVASSAENEDLTIKSIQRVVANSFRQPVSIMTDKDRPQSKAWPRMIAMALSRELTRQGLNKIGRQFGGRDHTCVIHALRTVKDRCEVSPDTAKLVRELRTYLNKAKA